MHPTVGVRPLPTDPETPTGIGALLAALFGAGGGGTALVKQIRSQAKTEQRVSALEGSVSELKAKDERHDSQFLRIETTLSALDERSKNAENDRQEMLQILREKL